MKVIVLGKIAQNKLCNLPPGTCFQLIKSDLTVDSVVYMKVYLSPHGESRYDGEGVNLETGQLVKHHPSAKVKIYPDACIVLDPIDRG